MTIKTIKNMMNTTPIEPIFRKIFISSFKHIITRIKKRKQPQYYDEKVS